MRKILNIPLVVALAGSALLAQTGKTLGPMERLTEGVYLIAQGTYDQALPHLIWCFDNGVKEDPEFRPVRDSSVIDALAFLVEVHPPTIQALKARRDTALTQAGNPPKISPAFFDVLALNRALGDDAASDELIQKAVAAGTVQKFGSGVQGPPALKSVLMVQKSLSTHPEVIEAKMIPTRAKAIFQFAKLETKPGLKARITEAKKMNATESLSISAKALQVNKEIAELKRITAKATPDEAKVIEVQLKRLDELQKAITFAREIAKAESDYLVELASWNSARSEK